MFSSATYITFLQALYLITGLLGIYIGQLYWDRFSNSSQCSPLAVIPLYDLSLSAVLSVVNKLVIYSENTFNIRRS
jgi:hypothetical protein